MSGTIVVDGDDREHICKKHKIGDIKPTILLSQFSSTLARSSRKRKLSTESKSSVDPPSVSHIPELPPMSSVPMFPAPLYNQDQVQKLIESAIKKYDDMTRKYLDDKFRMLECREQQPEKFPPDREFNYAS